MPTGDHRIDLLAEVAAAQFRIYARTEDPAAAQEATQLLLQAAKDTRSWLTAGRLAMLLANYLADVIRASPDKAGADEWRRLAAQGCLIGIEACLRAATAGRTRDERQAPLPQLEHLTAEGAELLIDAGEVWDAALLLERGRTGSRGQCGAGVPSKGSDPRHGT